MASNSRRAVISGLGVLSAIGLNAEAFWDSLCKQRTGIGKITSFDTSALPIHIAGEIRGFDAKNYLDKKERKNLRVMSRSIQLAVSGAQLALNDSQVDLSKIDPTRFGVEYGAGLIASELEELGDAAQVSANCQPGIVDLERWGDQGLQKIPPLWMLKYLPNMLACHVSIIHNAQGPNNTITENDAASLLALGEAFRILKRDQADFFLVGGADSKINPLSLVRHSLFMPLTRRNDEPEKACRPFDRLRDGVVPGEGAGVLVVEELEHARRRGARIYAEVMGFGASFDRDRSGTGLARAIRAALAQAQLKPDDIDHINALGISTVEGDAWEARAINEVFGNCAQPPDVLAVKSYIGNLSAGGGITELIASLLAMHHGQVPPTLNYEEPDPRCPVRVLANASRPLMRPYIVKLSFTELGQCAAVVCRKWES